MESRGVGGRSGRCKEHGKISFLAYTVNCAQSSKDKRNQISTCVRSKRWHGLGTASQSIYSMELREKVQRANWRKKTSMSHQQCTAGRNWLHQPSLHYNSCPPPLPPFHTRNLWQNCYRFPFNLHNPPMFCSCPIHWYSSQKHTRLFCCFWQSVGPITVKFRHTISRVLWLYGFVSQSCITKFQPFVCVCYIFYCPNWEFSHRKFGSLPLSKTSCKSCYPAYLII